jgi:hypothetical protein
MTSRSDGLAVAACKAWLDPEQRLRFKLTKAALHAFTGDEETFEFKHQFMRWVAAGKPDYFV